MGPNNAGPERQRKRSRNGSVENLGACGHMKTYEFDVYLERISEVADDQADALFARGCDDGTPACRDGMAWIHFDREAPSLEEAILSAVAQVRSAGFIVSKVELDVNAPAYSGALS